MFAYLPTITHIDLSKFDTSFVTNMSNMFAYCYSLQNIDVSNFNTRNVTQM
nr:BspA family leucine-rich repeat surface protein [bacterium]